MAIIRGKVTANHSQLAQVYTAEQVHYYHLSHRSRTGGQKGNVELRYGQKTIIGQPYA